MSAARDMTGGFNEMPAVGIEDLLGGRPPLILAPHPDDESLGCGGLIAAACAAGLPPTVAILTDGAASHPHSRLYPPARLAALREDEALEALNILGLPRQKCFFMREPDTKLSVDGALLDRLTAIALAEGCGIVIGPWQGDPHCDHETSASIAEAIAIRLGTRLLSYPVWGWLREDGRLLAELQKKGVRLDISGQLGLKTRAIAAHASQYGKLITDAPTGFQLPEDLLAVFARNHEMYLTR